MLSILKLRKIKLINYNIHSVPKNTIFKVNVNIFFFNHIQSNKNKQFLSYLFCSLLSTNSRLKKLLNKYPCQVSYHKQIKNTAINAMQRKDVTAIQPFQVYNISDVDHVTKETVINRGQTEDSEIIFISSDEESESCQQVSKTINQNLDTNTACFEVKEVKSSVKRKLPNKSQNSKSFYTGSRLFKTRPIYQNMALSTSLQMARSFSDSAIQNNWCLNPNYNLFGPSSYTPVCYVPVATCITNNSKKKKNKFKFFEPKKNQSHSVEDISDSTNNYMQNVQSEQLRLKNLRSWEFTDYGWKWERTGNKELEFIFTLMSYNVLAQILLTQHPYLYRQHDSRALFWDHRKWALLTEITQHNPDLLCLQEVEKTHLDSFYSQFNNIGYKGIYKQRTGIRIDGCALYYKHDKFDLVDYTTVEYFQPDVALLDRENVAIVARFRLKNNTQQEFVVATTHLLYNPKRQDIRLAQTQLLLAEIDRIAFDKFDENGKPTYLPIIITGDFNLKPYSPVYKLVVDGKFKYEGTETKSLSRKNYPKGYTGKELIPRQLRVTDNCQHADILLHRLQNNTKLTQTEQLSLIKIQHSERARVESNIEMRNLTKDNLPFATGVLTHNFNFKSVYNHKYRNDEKEATTHQDEWITVDYIFYSVKMNNNHKNDKTEGSLKLHSRYKIPSERECNELLYRIPNLVYGSDHLSLIAKFVFTENKNKKKQ